MNGSQALRQTLQQALDGSISGLSGPVHLLGEALELSPATSGLLDTHPDQLHLLPAADASLLGLAVGLAMSGKVVVVELADPSALVAALPQLVEASTLSQPGWPLHVVVRVPCGPDDSPLQPAVLGQLLPGLAVVSPSTPADLAALLHAALLHDGPVLILEPRIVLAARDPDAETVDLPLGRARVLRQGTDATLLAAGADVAVALRAADELQATGIDIDVVDLRSLAPLDLDTIGQRVRQTGRVIVVGDDHALTIAVQQAFVHLESPPARVSSPVDSAAITATVRASLHY
jgi:Pyruvate/2-oxoglutarate dehydrogenase complex, dehydrogenase (E1) component, eukaryotic type, beta subunit